MSAIPLVQRTSDGMCGRYVLGPSLKEKNILHNTHESVEYKEKLSRQECASRFVYILPASTRSSLSTGQEKTLHWLDNRGQCQVGLPVSYSSVASLMEEINIIFRREHCEMALLHSSLSLSLLQC